MKTFTAGWAKRNFGTMLREADGAPIGLTKRGRPHFVVMSIDEFDRMKSRIAALAEARTLALIDEAASLFESGDKAQGFWFIRFATAHLRAEACERDSPIRETLIDALHNSCPPD